MSHYMWVIDNVMSKLLTRSKNWTKKLSLPFARRWSVTVKLYCQSTSDTCLCVLPYLLSAQGWGRCVWSRHSFSFPTSPSLPIFSLLFALRVFDAFHRPLSAEAVVWSDATVFFVYHRTVLASDRMPWHGACSMCRKAGPLLFHCRGASLCEKTASGWLRVSMAWAYDQSKCRNQVFRSSPSASCVGWHHGLSIVALTLTGTTLERVFYPSELKS